MTVVYEAVDYENASNAGTREEKKLIKTKMRYISGINPESYESTILTPIWKIQKHSIKTGIAAWTHKLEVARKLKYFFTLRGVACKVAPSSQTFQRLDP